MANREKQWHDRLVTSMRKTFGGQFATCAFDEHNETWIVVTIDTRDSPTPDVYVYHVGSDDDHMAFQCLTRRSARVRVELPDS